MNLAHFASLVTGASAATALLVAVTPVAASANAPGCKSPWGRGELVACATWTPGGVFVSADGDRHPRVGLASHVTARAGGQTVRHVAGPRFIGGVSSVSVTFELPHAPDRHVTLRR